MNDDVTKIFVPFKEKYQQAQLSKRLLESGDNIDMGQLLGISENKESQWGAQHVNSFAP